MQSVAEGVKKGEASGHVTAGLKGWTQASRFDATIVRLPGKGLPLHGSDSSSFDDAPADLPLREQRPPADERRPVVERDLFLSAAARAESDAASQSSGGEVSGGGVTIGISMWLVAAGALVAGIIIGFASGYTAGQRTVTVVSAPSDSSPDEPQPLQEQPVSSQAFTEGAVTEPIRADPEPAVPAPEPPGAVPQRQPVQRSAPRPPRSAPVETAASGPGTLQILSRPSGAQVLVDGRVVGRTPLVMADVRSGSHDVRIELAGFRRWVTSVTVTPGTRTRVAASLEQ